MSIGNVRPCGCICHVTGHCGVVGPCCYYAGKLWENGRFVTSDISSPVMRRALEYTKKILSEKPPKKKSKNKK